MNPLRFVPLMLRNLARNRRRTLLMAAGIAVSVFVVSALVSVEAGFGTIIDSSQDTLLNVREKGLACPVTSRVFDSYQRSIERLPSVTASTGVLRGLYTINGFQQVAANFYDDFTAVLQKAGVDPASLVK